jgi:hypothetical protein
VSAERTTLVRQLAAFATVIAAMLGLAAMLTPFFSERIHMGDGDPFDRHWTIWQSSGPLAVLLVGHWGWPAVPSYGGRIRWR